MSSFRFCTKDNSKQMHFGVSTQRDHIYKSGGARPPKRSCWFSPWAAGRWSGGQQEQKAEEERHSYRERQEQRDRRQQHSSRCSREQVKETKDITAISVRGIRCRCSLTRAPSTAPGETLQAEPPRRQSPAAAQPPAQVFWPRPPGICHAPSRLLPP